MIVDCLHVYDGSIIHLWHLGRRVRTVCSADSECLMCWDISLCNNSLLAECPPLLSSVSVSLIISWCWPSLSHQPPHCQSEAKLFICGSSGLTEVMMGLATIRVRRLLISSHYTSLQTYLNLSHTAQRNSIGYFQVIWQIDQVQGGKVRWIYPQFKARDVASCQQTKTTSTLGSFIISNGEIYQVCVFNRNIPCHLTLTYNTRWDKF